MSEGFSIKFANRMEHLPPYLFGAINKMKMDKRLEGIDVIDLGMGNPIDPAPEPVIQKLCEVSRDPKTHRYPVAHGMANLRREIAKMYKQDYDVELDSEKEVICTVGSKEGLSHLSLALIGPGDTVMVPAPAFPIHIYSTIIAGGNVIRIPIERETFVQRIEHLCQNVLPRPKVLKLNFPHNPTGVLGDMELFEQIVALAKKYNFIVVHDFAYAKITFDGYVAPSFLQTKGGREIGVEFGSFSKSYNMAGLRLGYCVGNKQLIAALAKIKGYYDYGIFSAIQVAGIVALRECSEDIVEQVKKYESRRDVLCEGLNRMGWDIVPPKAGMFVWAKIPQPYDAMGSMDFCLALMEHANVAVAPGIGFGEEGEGYLRFALVENEHRIRQAMRQIKRAISQLDVQAG